MTATVVSGSGSLSHSIPSSSSASSNKYRPELSWIQVVLSETSYIISLMRRNGRWRISSPHDDESEYDTQRNDSNSVDLLKNVSLVESTGLSSLLQYNQSITLHRDPSLGSGPFPLPRQHPLLLGFHLLKSRLMVIQNLRDLDPLDLISPFLNVIISGDTNGPITTAALSSVEKFINYKIIDPHHPDLPKAISALTHAVTRCKFEATDIVSDEIVLDRILQLIKSLVLSESGKKCVTDKGICEMIEVAFGMHFQARISEILRRAAEETLLVLVQVVFERLVVITKEKEHREHHMNIKSRSQASPVPLKQLALGPPVSRKLQFIASESPERETVEGSTTPSRTSSLKQENKPNTKESDLARESVFLREATPSIHMSTPPRKPSPPSMSPCQPFDLPAIHELVRVLISLLDPKNKAHTDSLHRTLALKLLTRGLEVGGKALAKWVGYGFLAETILGASSGQPADSDNENSKPDLSRKSSSLSETTATSSNHHRKGSGLHDMHIATTAMNTNSVVSVSATGVTVTSADTKNTVADLSYPTDSVREEKESDPLLPPLNEQEKGETISEDKTRPENEVPAQASKQATTIINDQTPVKDDNVSITSKKEKVSSPEREKMSTQDEYQKMALVLKEMVTNDLCRFLFQLLQIQNHNGFTQPSWQGMAFLTQILRAISTLLTVAHEYLVLQKEWLLLFLMRACEVGVVAWDLGDWSSMGEGKAFFNEEDKERRREKEREREDQRLGLGGPEFLPYEIRELYLETILQLLRAPSIFAEMFIYHDGNLESRSQLFEELLIFLAKNAFPDATPGGPATTWTHQSLCLDGLLLFMRRLVDRRRQNTELPEVSAYYNFELESPRRRASMLDLLEGVEEEELLANLNDLSPEALVRNKQRKLVLREGSELFNKSVKEGLAFFIEKKILPEEPTPKDIAKLLATTPNLDKKTIGEYLAKPKHLETLGEFVHLFDFSGKRIDEAMRSMLDKFRLPGESQQIERIMDAFSKCYYESIAQDPERLISSEDATSILAFSIIMLNTDQHNPQVRKRMTLQDYSRNVRGVNDGKDFSQEYLKDIYNSIRHNEIVIAEEHGGELGFNHQWKELLSKRASIIPYTRRNTNIYDRLLFSTVWGPLLAALFHTLDNAEDSHTLHKAVIGIQHCAILSAHYELKNVIDYILISLSRMTGFLKHEGNLPQEKNVVSFAFASPEASREVLNANGGNEQNNMTTQGVTSPPLFPHIGVRPTQPQDYQGQISKPDRWIVDLGRNYRSQVGSILLFNLANEYGNVIEESWGHLVNALSGLFLHQLLPYYLLITEDFSPTPYLTIPRVDVPEPPKPQNSDEGNKKDTSGIFSTLSHFLSLGPFGDEGQEISPEDVAFEKMATECIQTCRVDEFIADSRYLEENALVLFVNAILTQSFSTTATTNNMTGQLTQPPEVDMNSSSALLSPATKDHPFERHSVFLLELLFNVALRNRDRIMTIWPLISEHLKTIFTCPSAPACLIERATTNTIRLLLRLADMDGLRSKILEPLHFLPKLKPTLFSSVAESTLYGFLAIAKADMAFLSKNTVHRSLVMGLLSKATNVPAASGVAFELACLIIQGHPEAPITTESFSEAVDVLIAFASATVGAAVGVIQPGTGTNVAGANGVTNGVGSRVRNTVSGKGEPARNVPLDRIFRAIDKIYALHNQIPALIRNNDLNGQRAWLEFWLPVLSGLSQQCSHPLREIRSYAIGLLQRVLLSQDLLDTLKSSSSTSVTASSTNGTSEMCVECFDMVMFPLLDELLKPGLAKVDPSGIDETRVRAGGLLAKVFLRLYSVLSSNSSSEVSDSGGNGEVNRVWARVLDYMGHTMHGGSIPGREEFLYEGVMESLKNMILVLMSETAFVLADDSTAGEKKGVLDWKSTVAKLEGYCPALKEELVLSIPRPQSQAPTVLNGDGVTGIESPQQKGEFAPTENVISEVPADPTSVSQSQS